MSSQDPNDHFFVLDCHGESETTAKDSPSVSKVRNGQCLNREKSVEIIDKENSPTSPTTQNHSPTESEGYHSQSQTPACPQGTSDPPPDCVPVVNVHISDKSASGDSTNAVGNDCGENRSGVKSPSRSGVTTQQSPCDSEGYHSQSDYAPLSPSSVIVHISDKSAPRDSPDTVHSNVQDRSGLNRSLPSRLGGELYSDIRDSSTSPAHQSVVVTNNNGSPPSVVQNHVSASAVITGCTDYAPFVDPSALASPLVSDCSDDEDEVVILPPSGDHDVVTSSASIVLSGDNNAILGTLPLNNHCDDSPSVDRNNPASGDRLSRDEDIAPVSASAVHDDAKLIASGPFDVVDLTNEDDVLKDDDVQVLEDKPKDEVVVVKNEKSVCAADDVAIIPDNIVEKDVEEDLEKGPPSVYDVNSESDSDEKDLDQGNSPPPVYDVGSDSDSDEKDLDPGNRGPVTSVSTVDLDPERDDELYVCDKTGQRLVNKEENEDDGSIELLGIFGEFREDNMRMVIDDDVQIIDERQAVVSMDTGDSNNNSENIHMEVNDENEVPTENVKHGDKDEMTKTRRSDRSLIGDIRLEEDMDTITPSDIPLIDLSDSDDERNEEENSNDKEMEQKGNKKEKPTRRRGRKRKVLEDVDDVTVAKKVRFSRKFHFIPRDRSRSPLEETVVAAENSVPQAAAASTEHPLPADAEEQQPQADVAHERREDAPVTPTSSKKPVPVLCVLLKEGKSKDDGNEGEFWYCTLFDDGTLRLIHPLMIPDDLEKDFERRDIAVTACEIFMKAKMGSIDNDPNAPNSLCLRHRLARLEWEWAQLNKGKAERIYIINRVDMDMPTLKKYLTTNTYSKAFMKRSEKLKDSIGSCNCEPGQSCVLNTQCACYRRRELSYSLDGLIEQDADYKGSLFECGPHCGCGPDCGLRVVQNGRKVPLVLSKEPKIGYGVRAGRAIKKGEFIGEMTGEILTKREAERRKNEMYQMSVMNHMGKARGVLDARLEGNVIRYVNHSCEPNSRMVSVFHCGLPRGSSMITLFATKDIMQGDAIRYNYYEEDAGMDWEESYYRPCECGADTCTGSMPPRPLPLNRCHISEGSATPE